LVVTLVSNYDWRVHNERGTRRVMVTAARNVAGLLSGWPVWRGADVTPFLTAGAPQAAPSIVNAHELGLPVLDQGAGS
jgi:hypothetical protein